MHRFALVISTVPPSRRRRESRGRCRVAARRSPSRPRASSRPWRRNCLARNLTDASPCKARGSPSVGRCVEINCNALHAIDAMLAPWDSLVCCSQARFRGGLSGARADLWRRRIRAPDLYGRGLGGGTYRAALVGKSRGLGRVPAALDVYVSQRRGVVAFS